MSNPFDQFDKNPFDQFDKVENQSPGFGQQIGNELSKHLLNVVDTGDRALSGLAGGLASIFSTEEADNVFGEMTKRTSDRKKKIQALSKDESGTTAKLAALAMGLIPLAAAMPFSTFKSGQEALETGETLEKAQDIAAIDTLGNMAGVLLPPGLRKNGAIPGALTGAGINVAQDAATRKIIQDIAEQEETKKNWEITPDSILYSAAPGVVFGGLHGYKPKTKKTPEPSKADKLDALAKERDIVKQEDPNLEFWKQRAEQMTEEARKAELPPEVIRAQQETPFNPYPVAGDVASMEAMARANEGIEYAQLPPDAVVPRDSQFFQGERDKAMLRVPRGNEWIKDENGMPVRQGLPETTVDPSYLQRYMPVDERARNDLGNAIQEVNGPQLSPGKEIGSERLEGPISGDAAIGVGPGIRGPRRGAVNPQIFQMGFTKDKDLGNGLLLRLVGDEQSPTIEAYQDGQKIGMARFERDKYYQDINAEKDNLQPRWVNTVPEHQKKGVAKEMYRFMAEMGNDLIPDYYQTSYGKKLWESMERDGLAKDRKVSGLGPSGTGLAPTRGAVSFDMSPKQKQDFVESILKLPQRAEMPSSEDIVREALAEGKDGRGVNTLEAGSSLAAMKRRSSLIQGVSRVFQGHTNIAEYNVKERVFPIEESVRGLSKQELTELAGVFTKEMFNRKRYDMDLMLEAGFSEKQLLAYKRIRDAFTDVLQRQNEARAERGLPTITELDAYLSSRWQGDFRRGFRDENGKLVWVLAADNKLQLNAETRALFKQFPELKKGSYSDQTVKALKNRQDPQAVYQMMSDLLGDDPAVQKIKDWYAGKLEEQGAATLGQEKHFEPKGNVRGFIGDRPWRNPTKEAIALFQSQVDYIKHGYRWAEMQKAVKHVSDILTNKELTDQQPNNMAYVKDYVKEQLGANEHAAIRGLEDALRDAGISPNQISRGVNNVKAFWILQKLAFNLGYGAANVIQLANSVPHIIDLQHKYGGNPVISSAIGTAVGSVMVGLHPTSGQAKVNAYKKLAQMLPGDTEWTPFILQAMKYAEDNNVISKSAYDESPIESSFSKTGAVARVASKSISLPDSLRAVAFMTYATQLKTSGKFDNPLEIFRMADERTRASMADYNQAEKAMVFSKLGTVGQAANTLQTFSVNWLNQWSWGIREAKKGNYMPVVAMGMIQYALAGAMGIPGFSDLDKLFEFSKDWLKEHAPKQWAKVRNLSLKEFIINYGGEHSLYGPLSDISDVAFTSRVAAPSTTDMVSAPFAPVVDLVKQGADVASFIGDPLNEQKAKQALYNITPSGLQGALETTLLRDDVSVPSEKGRIYRKPKDLSDRAGQYERTPDEEAKRLFGMRSQKEAVTRDLDWKFKKREINAKDVVRDLPEKMYNSLRRNDTKSAKEWLELHVELTGKPISSQMLENLVLRENTTPGQRMILQKNKPLETIMIIKRHQELMKELGYQE